MPNAADKRGWVTRGRKRDSKRGRSHIRLSTASERAHAKRATCGSPMHVCTYLPTPWNGSEDEGEEHPSPEDTVNVLAHLAQFAHIVEAVRMVVAARRSALMPCVRPPRPPVSPKQGALIATPAIDEEHLVATAQRFVLDVLDKGITCPLCGGIGGPVRDEHV